MESIFKEILMSFVILYNPFGCQEQFENNPEPYDSVLLKNKLCFKHMYFFT